MRAMTQGYRFGGFTLESGERQLRRQGREIVLRPKTFDTLEYLSEHQGHLVDKDELLNRVWSGTNVTETVLTYCITEARQALQDDAHNPRYIKTIPRVGYKFIGKMQESGLPSVEPAVRSQSAAASAIVVMPFANLSADPENEYFCQVRGVNRGTAVVAGLKAQAPCLRPSWLASPPDSELLNIEDQTIADVHPSRD